MKSPLVDLAEKNEDKFFALFNQYGGRLSFEEKSGEKGDFLEIKVLNEQAKLAGIVWFFGPRRAYIEDIRLMTSRKETQLIEMVLLAGEGTTSAGKKELREADIRLVKDLDMLKSPSKKKKRKKSKAKKKDVVSIDDDVSIADIPDTPLIKLAQTMIKEQEPDIIRVREIKGVEVKTHEVRGYTSTNDVLAVYRTVESKSIGVKAIRQFSTTIEDIGSVPVAIIGSDKFTHSAKKEASDFNINLISEREEYETKGDEEQQQLTVRLESGVIDMIKRMGYTPVKKTESRFIKLRAGNESLGKYVIAENDKENLVALLPSEEVVRVATVREFSSQMEKLKIKKGMLVPLKRFTYTAEREAKDYDIMILKNNHPVFDIFEHYLVPEHQLMTKDEIDDMLVDYNARLNQLPRMYEDDPGVVAVSGKVGDIVRIIRGADSFNFRLVVPRPDADVTESTALMELTEEIAKRKKKKKKVKVSAK